MSDKTARPFEVGDLVICTDGKLGLIKRYEPLLALSPCFVEFKNYESWTENYSSWLKSHEIKTIRKPRKGSKEARDIVAMLAYSYWKSLKGLSKGWLFGVEEEKHKEAMKDWWNRRKRKDEFILRSSVYFEYQKAKSMLK